MLPVLFLFAACDQDLSNPNAASEDQILNSTEGLVSMVNGMKFRYTVGGAGGLYAGVSGNGLTTRELRVLNAGNADLAQMENGFDNVAPSNSVVTNLWTNVNLIRSDAEKIMDNAPNVIEDGGTLSGVLAYAHLFKALSLGTMAQFWEQAVPLTGENAEFVSRNQALEEAIDLLDEAIKLIATTPPSNTFNSVVGTDINIKNALLALTARYELMLGNLDAALNAANAVDLGVKSQFVFDNVNPNPVFRSSLITQNVYDVNLDFGLPADLLPDILDGRRAFYLTPNANSGKGFFTADNAPIPLYLPGEMILIKAEAYARKDLLPQAVAELDKILTKKDDIFGVNANLPPYSGPQTKEAILKEIYKNRCVELFMSGLKLEDCRRFGRPGPEDLNNYERNRNFYPYPTIERDNNANTPADPAV